VEVAWGAHTQIVPWAQSFPPIWHIVDANGDNVLSKDEAKVAIVGRVTSYKQKIIFEQKNIFWPKKSFLEENIFWPKKSFFGKNICWPNLKSTGSEMKSQTTSYT